MQRKLPQDGGYVWRMLCICSAVLWAANAQRLKGSTTDSVTRRKSVPTEQRLEFTLPRRAEFTRH